MSLVFSARVAHRHSETITAFMHSEKAYTLQCQERSPDPHSWAFMFFPLQCFSGRCRGSPVRTTSRRGFRAQLHYRLALLTAAQHPLSYSKSKREWSVNTPLLLHMSHCNCTCSHANFLFINWLADLSCWGFLFVRKSLFVSSGLYFQLEWWAQGFSAIWSTQYCSNWRIRWW